jgi:hypothetical protein
MEYVSMLNGRESTIATLNFVGNDNTTKEITIYAFCDMDGNPSYYEVIYHDRKWSDEIAKTGGEHTLNTVSTDATDIYYHYGKKLGIDIHIYLDGKEITFPKLFTSYNKSIDYCDFIVNKE